MPYSISTLLNRNLQEVLSENDAPRRRAAIDELCHEDGVSYDPGKRAFLKTYIARRVSER